MDEAIARAETPNEIEDILDQIDFRTPDTHVEETDRLMKLAREKLDILFRS